MPDKSCYQGFHDALYEGYRQVMSGEKPVLFKMKELWLYLLNSFQGGETYWKKVKKVQKLSDYEKVTEAIFKLDIKLDII